MIERAFAAAFFTLCLAQGGAAQAATPADAAADATPTSNAYEDTGVDSAVFDDEEL